MHDESERRESWRREKENRRRRLELEHRLEEILRARGALPWSEPRAEVNETVEVKLTLEEVTELVGALGDSWLSFGLRDQLHRIQSEMRDLDEALLGSKNPRDVLRKFGRETKKRRGFREDVEVARFYWNLTQSGPLIPSPQSLRRVPPAPRPFGALFAVDDARGVGRSYKSPVEPIEAIRIIRKEYGLRSNEAARCRIVRGRKALRAAARMGWLRPPPQSPGARPSGNPPLLCDPPFDFAIPSAATVRRSTR